MDFAQYSLTDIGLVVLSGLIAGAINAVAGGGTFFSFGALTLIGIPPITANATSAISMFPGYVSSALAYRKEIATMTARLWPLVLVSLAGALAGSLLLLSLNNPTFHSLVPWLLIAATALFAIGPALNRLANTQSAKRPRAIAVIVQFLNSIYGGFFGAGLGIMMLATLGLTEGWDYHRTNALKNALSVFIACVAIVVFAGGGIIAWSAAVLMIPATTFGGWFGVEVARKAPQIIVRGFVVAVGIGLTLYYFLTG